MEDAPRRHVGELFAALVAMGFGSAYVATSVALAAFDPLPLAAWRTVLATLAVGTVMAVVRSRRRSQGAERGAASGGAAGPAAGTGQPPPLAARAVRLLTLSILAGPLFLSSMNLAVAHVGAAIAAFVAGLYAVLAAVFAPFLLPERLTARVLGGFALAVVGTGLLAELAPDAIDLSGIGWGVLAAVAFALYLVLTRRWSHRYRLDGLTVALSNAATTAVVLGGFLLVTDPASLVPSSPPLTALVALGWIAGVAAIGPVLTVASLRRIPAARSAAFLLLNPITATFLAVLLLGESLSPLQALGGLLVLLGMATAIVPTGPGGDAAVGQARREAVP